MPLAKGKSKKTISKNISELMNSHNTGGSFAQGKGSAKARQMAVAAAFAMSKQRRGGK